MTRRHPRIARDTRLLLGVMVVSVATLWALARLRFPERPASPDPVAPVLAQLAPPSPFDAIATAVSELERKVGDAIVRVTFTPRASDPGERATGRVAIRIAPDRAIVVLPPSERPGRTTPALVAAAPRLAVGLVPIPVGSLVPSVSWPSDQLPRARFVIAIEGANDGVSFRPVFLGAFTPARVARWPGVVWRLPASSAISDGALVFTSDGLFLGAVAVRSGERSLIPVETLVVLARQLAEQTPRSPGVLGFAVQELTALVAEAVGADRGGVVVSWVDPQGPAAAILQPLDAIDMVDGEGLTTREQWDARLEQLEVGQALGIRIRRAGAEPRTVTLTAGAPVPRARAASLGADVRSRARVGTEVLRVQPGGAADHAGLRAGDVITAVGTRAAPTAAQLMQAYAETEEDQLLAIAVARGTTHVVLVLEKAW